MKVKTFFVSVIICCILLWTGCNASKNISEGIHIAVVGTPAFKNAVDLYFDEVNKNNETDGKKIIIDYFNDQNNPDTASKIASEIASKNQAVAVIGHYYSSCSISAGPVYKEARIPAITPTSLVPDVTIDNEWYFRTAPTDTNQARFLAIYIKNILKENTASIIYEEGLFDHFFDIFEETSDLIGLGIKYRQGFNKKTGDPQQIFKRIAEELNTETELGTILLAVVPEDGLNIIKHIRDAGIQNTIMGTDINSEKFFQFFNRYPEEIRKPGYYTKNIYSSSPLIFDSANMAAQKFQREYKERYKHNPRWDDAFVYDAAILVHQAIKDTGIKEEPNIIKNDRKKIRDYLANLNKYNAVKGLNTPNYFDKNGDSVGKQFFIGMYKQGNIISAPGQLRPVSNPEFIANIEDDIKNGKILRIGNDYMHKINIVYTGVELALETYESGYHVGFNFYHRELTRDNLVYVTDILGMGVKDNETFPEKMKNTAVVDSIDGWIIDHILFSHDTIEKSMKGSLKHLDNPEKYAEYSRFDFTVALKNKTLSLRRKIPGVFAGYLVVFCFLMLLFLKYKNKTFKNYPKSVWLFKVIVILILTLSLESFLTNLVFKYAASKYRILTILIFNILYWIVFAFFIHLGMYPFIWEPMERKSGRPVPMVLRHIPVYFIYFIAIYGIITFEFDLDINKLMATSGVLAMGIGYLIKDNIANYFASISIFQSHEIRIGHWIKVGDFEEGKVQEITRMVTRIMKRDGAVLSIPNNLVLNSSIENYSLPDDSYMLTFKLETVPEYSPAHVIQVIEAGIFSIEGVLKDPKPMVVFEGQGDSSAKYTVKFSVRDYEMKFHYLTDGWKSVWSHLEKAGIELATPHRILHLLDETPQRIDETPQGGSHILSEKR